MRFLARRHRPVSPGVGRRARHVPREAVPRLDESRRGRVPLRRDRRGSDDERDAYPAADHGAGEAVLSGVGGVTFHNCTLPLVPPSRTIPAGPTLVYMDW